MTQKQSVVMYGRQRFCPDVARSRARLTDLGISWTEYDVEADDAAKDQVFRLTGRTSVPALVIGDTILVEPSNAELDAALAAVGFDTSDDARG